ncbi:MAG: MFS transporter [Thermoplasmata archaeon]|nr:MFS transporter [Thermoplasmata archaeon]
MAEPTPPPTPPVAPSPPKDSAVIENPVLAILVVLGIMTALLMGALDNFVVLTALSTILKEFGQPNGGSFVVSAYIIASTVAVPIFAKLSDIFSRRNVFLGGLALFIGGSILAGLSQSLPELIFFRAVQGFGSGDFFPVGLAIVAVSFTGARRARVTGLLSGVFGIATVAGPLIGSAIVDHTTWRWVFYVNIPIGLVGIGILLATLGALRPTRVRHFDIPGAALLAGWVGALMYALLQVSNAGWSWVDPRVLGLLIGAVVLVIVFIAWELRTSEPLVPLRLLGNRIVAASGGSAFLVGMVFFPLVTFVSLIVGFLYGRGGANPADLVRDTLYALVIPVVLGAAIGGQLATRFSYRAIILGGTLLTILGTVFLAQLTVATPLWTFAFGFIPDGGIVLPLIPLGFGVGLTFPVSLLAVQSQVASADLGEASGLLQFLRTLGGSIGLTALASVQQLRMNFLDPSPDPSCTTHTPLLPLCGSYLQAFPGALVTSYDQVFTVMLAITVVSAVVASFLRGRLIKRAPSSASGSGGG